MKIYLIGMPGCGKSRTGRELNELLNYEFIDLDSYIEAKYHKSIEEIFKSEGEEAFRSYETSALKDFLNKDNLVISTGGGIVKNALNKPLLQGLTIYLDAPLDLIKEHILLGDNKRPLLKTKSLLELYNERKELYLDFMDYKVSYTTSKEVSLKIYNFIKNGFKKKKVLVMNGPNLNMLGKRDPKHYGSYTLEMINDLIKKETSFSYDFFQSNSEGALIDRLQEENYDALILNAGAYTHTSLALHDALEIIKVLKIEVHLSKVDNREDFRKINFIRDVCDECFSGLKELSYVKAVRYLKIKLNVI